MKTSLLRSGLLAASCLLLNLAFANPGGALAGSPSRDQARLQHAVQRQIDRHVIFPLSGNPERMYGEVSVSYAVDAHGELVVLSAESVNVALRNYVVRKLKQLRVGANPSGLWSISHARFVFKPE
ncbi:MAG TPA: hypothetical protein PKD45_07805 [Flavobacteriales bacterium]|nr:hypothetical protein [Flavobacteriales bacterium]